jgi:hypothetical protein
MYLTSFNLEGAHDGTIICTSEVGSELDVYCECQALPPSSSASASASAPSASSPGPTHHILSLVETS